MPHRQEPARLTGDPLDELVFWSAGHADRYAFLHAIQSKAAAQGRRVRLDTGWDSFDLEVLASTWNRIQLATVTEELDQGRRTIRCRLDTAWSPRAKLFFALVIAFTAVTISSLRELVPWIWMTLVFLPLALWFIEEDRLIQQAAFAGLLESAAAEHGLVRVKAAEPSRDRETPLAAAKPQQAFAEP